MSNSEVNSILWSAARWVSWTSQRLYCHSRYSLSYPKHYVLRHAVTDNRHWRYCDVLCSLQTVCPSNKQALLTLTEDFPCFFLSCKANARVKLAKTEHGPHYSTLVVICVVRLLFVLFYILFVCKYVLYYCHRVSNQLQLTNISISNTDRQQTYY